MGRCSGFPSCCIAFYSTGWRILFGSSLVPVQLKHPWRRKVIRWYIEASDAGYVPCPLCMISGARVKVRRCTKECGHIEESRRLILDQFPDAELR
jgi:hypothetical protein